MEKGERGEEIEKGERERRGGIEKGERGEEMERERGERESCVSFARVLVNQCEGL